MRSARLFRNDNVVRMFRPFWDSSRSQKFAGNSLVSKKSDRQDADPYEGNFSFTECDQFAKVTVIGAAGRVGRTLSLLLKTCPLVDHLCLFDTDKSIKGIGVDIGHIDTKCCVSYVCGMRNIHQALDAPDVVIIAAGCPASPHLNGRKLFDKNAPIVAGLSEACARFCPKACIVLITSPINSLLPVMGEVFQIVTNRIPSRKMFGLTTLDVVRANTFVAEVVRMDPNSVIVPVIGGTSQDTIVPVISQMKPCFKIKRGEMMALTECIKRAEGNLADCQNCGTRGASSLSTAYAAFRFTTSLVMALKGADNIIECAFVKSDIIPELEYLASPLKLGVRGIEYNFGYPPLSDHELLGLERAAPSLLSDIELGKAYASNIRDTVHEGVVWKRLNEEVEREGKVEPEKVGRTKRRRKTEKMAVADLGAWFRGRWLRSREPGEDFPPGDLGEGLRKSQVVSAMPLMIYLNDEKESEDKKPEDHGDVSKSNPPGHWPTSVFQPRQTGTRTRQTARGYHTINRRSLGVREPNKNVERYKRYLMEDRVKTVIPARKPSVIHEAYAKYKAKTIERSSKKSAWNNSTHYKTLNMAAKQKFRNFKLQKKFSPSASVLLLLEQKRRKELQAKSKELTKIEEPADKEKKEEEEEEEEEEVKPETEDVSEEREEKELLVPKTSDKDDSVRYREFVLNQLRELRRENEQLKKKILDIVENRNLESSLQAQTDKLELEKTKLKACWLIMSSTMDAFSNFCRKFTTRPDEKLPAKSGEDAEEGEEFEDALDEPPEKETYQDRYYKFLERLMDGQVDCERRRKRMGK